MTYDDNDREGDTMSTYSREAALRTVDPVHGPAMVLDDPVTRPLVLADLARRVGLDPSWGVTWAPLSHQRGRLLSVASHPGRYTRRFVPICETGCCTAIPAPMDDPTDPTEALLRATRPEETP